MNYECCANCKLCDKAEGYRCMIRTIYIDDPFSDSCVLYQPVKEDNEDAL